MSPLVGLGSRETQRRFSSGRSPSVATASTLGPASTLRGCHRERPRPTPAARAPSDRRRQGQGPASPHRRSPGTEGRRLFPGGPRASSPCSCRDRAQQPAAGGLGSQPARVPFPAPLPLSGVTLASPLLSLRLFSRVSLTESW